jgi:hypothetical protein
MFLTVDYSIVDQVQQLPGNVSAAEVQRMFSQSTNVSSFLADYFYFRKFDRLEFGVKFEELVQNGEVDEHHFDELRENFETAQAASYQWSRNLEALQDVDHIRMVALALARAAVKRAKNSGTPQPSDYWDEEIARQVCLRVKANHGYFQKQAIVLSFASIPFTLFAAIRPGHGDPEILNGALAIGELLYKMAKAAKLER